MLLDIELILECQVCMLSEYVVLSNMNVCSLRLISNELPSVGNTTWVTYMMELHHWLAETETRTGRHM